MASRVFYDRIYSSFVRQGLMTTIGGRLGKVDRGTCEVFLPYSNRVTQQQGGFHGGAIGSIADIAAGYAALTVAPEDMEVVTVEYKINFVAAFQGGELKATGKVIKEGRRLFVTTADVVHINEHGEENLCAILQQTIVPVPKKSA